MVRGAFVEVGSVLSTMGMVTKRGQVTVVCGARMGSVPGAQISVGWLQTMAGAADFPVKLVVLPLAILAHRAYPAKKTLGWSQ